MSRLCCPEHMHESICTPLHVQSDAHADDLCICVARTSHSLAHLTHALLLRAAQALRNLTLEGDPEVLRREVARLTAELAALRGGRNAAALELMSNELAAANEAGPLYCHFIAHA